MPESKDTRITLNIETSYAVLVKHIAHEHGWSVGAYLRKLVVDDLNKRGKLSQALLLRMATTDSMQDVQDLVARAG